MMRETEILPSAPRSWGYRAPIACAGWSFAFDSGMCFLDKSGPNGSTVRVKLPTVED